MIYEYGPLETQWHFAVNTIQSGELEKYPVC